MLKQWGMILLVVALGGDLGGCLVQKKDPADVTTYTSTDPVLRFYQSGDTLDYRVQVENNGSFQSGTLRVKWEDTNPISDPFASGATYDVLKETTTLTLDQNTPQTLVRYIEQDTSTSTATSGSLHLRAFDDPASATEFLWLSPSNTVPTSAVQRYELFRSPLDTAATAGSIDLGTYYVVGNCNGTSCADQLASVSNNSFEVTATNQTLNLEGIGIFENVYQVQYNATLTPQQNAPLLDMLAVCGAAGQFTSHQTTLYVVPEIGVIKMENTCTDTNGSVFYVITLDSTSFPY